MLAHLVMKDGLVIDVDVPNHRRHPENSSDLEHAACAFDTFDELADKCRRIMSYDNRPARVIHLEIVGDARFEIFKVIYLQNGRELSCKYSASQFHDLTK